MVAATAAVDYLTPFMPSSTIEGSASSGVVGSGRLERGEAQRARDACLKSLKDRLLERANIIQVMSR